MQSNCSTTWEGLLDYSSFPPNRPQKRPVGPNNPRTRSFGGCVTCRNRHVKCDEARPTCATCRWLGLECGGYGKSIFFESDADAVENGVVRMRRLLMTVEERQRMSESMTSMVQPRSAVWHISRIEEECENATDHEPIQVIRGPFGAFRVNHQTSPAEDSTSTYEIENIDEINVSLDFDGAVNDDTAAPETALSPWTQRVFQSIFDFSGESSDPMGIDSFDLMWGSGRIEEIFDDVPLPPDMQTFSINSIHPAVDSVLSPSNYNCPPFVSGSQLNPWSTRLSPGPIPSTNHVMPPHTVLLLNHFSTTVINSLTPFRHTKTPWHIIFVPLANQCLAALTLGNDLDHASLTAFYGMLAISAFSLGGQSRSSMWLEQGHLYKQQAREHARMMLKTAYNIPKVSKYKTILLAMITMVQVSIFSGNRDQTECYLLETEKFIRLRGLNKKKSRRVRLLHHCYAYERMFHESTFLAGSNSSQRHHVRNAVESSGLGSYSYDNLTFRLPATWRSLDQELLELKTQEAGENDLHVEKAGVFPTTLYPEIFGVPELYLHLLSLTIRLGYEKDASEQVGSTQTLSLVDFTRRAKEIEKHINRLTPPSEINSCTTDQKVLNHMFQALQNALAIYFYRRIYNLDSSMLQTHVSKVLESLKNCEQKDQNLIYGTARAIWPAFIAACEADRSEIQKGFEEWFENSAERSGLSIFGETLKQIQKIWTAKKSLEGGVTWLDVIRKEMF